MIFLHPLGTSVQFLSENSHEIKETFYEGFEIFAVFLITLIVLSSLTTIENY